MLLWSKKELGVNIAVYPRLQHISHTQSTPTLSRIKCEGYIFIKKYVRSFIEVRILCLIMFLHIFVYVYVCGYTTISRLAKTKGKLEYSSISVIRNRLRDVRASLKSTLSFSLLLLLGV